MNSDKTEAKRLCFVIGPIGGAGTPTRTHADWLLQGIIEPVFKVSFPEFEVERADKITLPGMIDSQVINRLLDAELVIADMSMANANAFYEMGIRHMAQKPIIHMYLDGSEIPFDVKPYRAIPFSVSHPNDLTAAQEILRKAIVEATSHSFKVENPVTRARGQIQLQQHATPEQRVLIDEIADIRENQRRMEAALFRLGSVPRSRLATLGQISASEILSETRAYTPTDGWAILVEIDPKISVDDRELFNHVRSLVGTLRLEGRKGNQVVLSVPTAGSDQLRSVLEAKLRAFRGVKDVSIIPLSQTDL